MDWKLLSIFLCNFLCCLTYDVIAPFYPVEALHIGLSHFQTGLVFSVMPLAGFLVAPVIGTTMYRVGRRATFIVGILTMVLSIQAASMACMGLADMFPPTLFFLLSLSSRILSGIGTGFVYTVCSFYTANAYIASDYPENMNELIAFTETFSGLGLVVGPVLGAGLYAVAGYKGVFAGLTVVYVLGCIGLSMLLQADRPYKIANPEESALLNLSQHFAIIVNCLPITFTMVAVGFCDTVLGPHFEVFGLSPTQVGLLWALSDSGYMIVSCLLAKVLDRLDLKCVNLAGIALVVLSYWMLGPWTALFPQSLTIVVVGLTLLSIAVATHCIASLPSLIRVAVTDLRIVKDDLMIDALSAMVASATCLGEMLGPALGGFFVDLSSVEVTGQFFGFAESAVLALYCGYYYRYKASRKHSENRYKESFLTTD